MSDIKKVVERLKKEAKLTVQVGQEGEIIGEPTGYVSTRCPTIDFLIGRPGIPLGGISLLVGAYGSGKSTIVLQILAEMQAQGGRAFLFDTEGRLNFSRATKIGVDMNQLIVAQPDTLEECLAGVKKTIQIAREQFDPEERIVIAVDSIAGAPMEKDVKGETSALAAQAVLIRKELRVLSNLVNRQRIGLVLTSQPRANIQIGKYGGAYKKHWMGRDPIGHAALVTVYLEEKAKFGDDPTSPIGHHIQAELMDTRFAGCEVEGCRDCTRKGFTRTFDFYDAVGPDFFGSALDVLMNEAEVITYAGGWYRFKEGKPFRRDDFEAQLEKEPAILEALGTFLQGGHHD